MSNPKLLADDTSLFSMVKKIDTSDIESNNILKKISECAFQWRMTFNPDRAKQAQELDFPYRMQTINHPSLCFNQNIVPQTSFQKH